MEKKKFIDKVIDGTSRKVTVNVLGSKWTIKVIPYEEMSPYGENLGLAFHTGRTILILDPINIGQDEYSDIKESIAKTIRHELIHAYMFESGIGIAYTPSEDEVMVDWFANQFGKMYREFDKLGIGDIL